MDKGILYLSYDGLTDTLGQSQVLPYVCGLSKLGYQFTIISFEKPDKYQLQKETVAKICKAYNVDWQPLKYTKHPPVLSTIKDVIALKRKALALHKKKHFLLVHCRSYITALVGLQLKRKFKIKFLFDMRGFWPDEKVEGDSWNLSNPVYNSVYKWFKRKEKNFLQEADYIISLTNNGKREILSWHHIKNNPLPIEVIPCCVDMELFDPGKISKGQQDDLNAKLGITENDFVLSYLGSIGLWYMLDEMLDFFKRLLFFKPTAKFLLITPEPANIILEKAAEKNIDKNLLYIVFANRKDVPVYISISKFSIFFIKPVYSKKASSPTKQAEIMAMGVPVICNAGIGDTDEIINNCEAGLIIQHFDAQNYDTIIEQMFSTLFDKEKIIRGTREMFSLKKGIEQYDKVYKKLL